MKRLRTAPLNIGSTLINTAMRHALGLALLLSLTPALAAAQGADSAQGTLKLPATDSAKRLPADRTTDLLTWFPGGSFDIDGRSAWHGRTAEGLDRSIDGILWNSLIRSTGRNGNGATVRRLEPAFNAIGSAWLRTGTYGADQNVGGPGALGYTTRGGGDRWSVTGTAESEEPLRADGGQGTSRFEAAAGGPLGRDWRVRASGVLTGRRFAPTGVEYEASPYFVPTGTDTTFTFPDGASLTDSVTVGVQEFGVTGSTPYSPRTTTDLAARVDGKIANASVWARYLLGGDGERLFSYENVSNTGQTFARNGTTQDLAAGASVPLGTFRLEAALGWQEDHSEEGPIDTGDDTKSRDPALGVMLGGVPLRFTMDNFAVDDELMWNYRLNTPGSRRSPFDLENTAQYQLVDQYRNNAYGLLGFSETGGPIGTLRLYRDSRWALSAALHHPLGGGDFAVGGELRQHDIQYYSHGLTSQALSDVWMEQPKEQALFANWRTGGSNWKLTAGIRMDRFATGARRPRMFPRLSSSGTYVDPASGDTLRWSRVDAPGDSAAWYEMNTVEDEAHVAVSPRVAIEGILAEGWTGHLSFGRLARTPDLAVQMGGLNTDYAITSLAQAWGSDYGHEITDVIEGGVRYGEADRWVDLTLYRENNKSLPGYRLVSAIDPNSGSPRDFVEAQLRAGPIYTGYTLAGRIPATEWLGLWGSFSHISSDGDPAPFIPEGEMVRPSTLVLAAEVTPATTGALGGFGGIISWRQASALARVVDPGFGPFPAGNVRDDNISSWRTLDLRVTKAFPLGSSSLTVYLDARNLLDFENLTRAFLEGDPTSNAGGANDRWLNDSSAFASEAQASGQYNAGTIDLAFGGVSDPRASCGAWQTAAGRLSPPNCAYLIAAEERFGDGDHLFTLTEQRRASDAYWRTQNSATRFSAPGRSLRIGAQIGF